MDELEAEMQNVERLARREQMAAESEALQLRLARRSLVEVCREAMHRGSELTVSWPGGRLTGYAQAAVKDLVVLGLVSGVAAVCLPAVTRIDEGPRNPERASTGFTDPGSFPAWCRSAEGTAVQVLSSGGIQTNGVMTAVAADHLLLSRPEGATAVSLDAVVAVRADRDPLFGF